MKIKVLIDFVDLSVNRTRHVSDVFEVTEERFSEIDAALPGFIEKFEKDVSEKDIDAEADKSEVVDKIPDSGNKIDEIRVYLTAHGIEYDDDMKKADLLDLIK